jgi:phosphopantothenoylcysteine decarboxylase/phosphopantothenate--cysteine ligase
MLKGKRIVIGITGSIAAYKIPLLVRLIVKEGAEVRVMMTEAATDFVTPLTISTLSGHPVLIKPFDEETGSWNSHVELGHWADLFVLAPLSANTLAKMATGITDNFLTAAYLSAKCPVMFAPAMDLDMYRHPSTAKNIHTLQSYGNILISPAVGELASGLYGEGRMEEPENIFSTIKEFFKAAESLSGKNVLVTAGPTHEPIDPVRYVGNHSSGKMGFALAESLAGMGAKVSLVCGPVNLTLSNDSIDRIDVGTAGEMYEAVNQLFPDMDMVFMAAAVADYTPSQPEKSKIKKSSDKISIDLVKTPDILKGICRQKSPGQLIIGFALETDNEVENARKKLKDKNLDFIVLNSLNEAGAGFGTDTNKVTILGKDGSSWESTLKPKSELAREIIEYVTDSLR